MEQRKGIPTQSDFETLNALEKKVIELRKLLDKERAEHRREIEALKTGYKEKLKARTQRNSVKLRKLNPSKRNNLTHDRRKVENIRKMVAEKTGVDAQYLYPTRTNTKTKYANAKIIFNYLVLTQVGITLQYTQKLLGYVDHTTLGDVQDKVEHWINHPKQYQKENEILKSCQNTIRSVRSRLVTMAM